MNSTTQPDIAEVARGLSRMQRAALKHIPSVVLRVPRDCTSTVTRGLRRLRIIEPITPEGGYAYRLTPLGLAVRAHLLSEQTHDG